MLLTPGNSLLTAEPQLSTRGATTLHMSTHPPLISTFCQYTDSHAHKQNNIIF